MVQGTSCLTTMRFDNLRSRVWSCNTNSRRRDGNSSCRKEGNGLIFDYMPGYRVDNHVEIRRLADSSFADKEVTSSESESAEDSADGEDVICPDPDQIWLWKSLVMSCDSDSKLEQFNIFKEVVWLYMQSESDALLTHS